MPQQPQIWFVQTPKVTDPPNRAVNIDYVTQNTASVQLATTPAITSTTYTMNGSTLLVRASNTKAVICATGNISQTTNGRETDVVLCYGTGTPPNNGDPQVGTILTQPARFVSTSGGGTFAPFNLPAVVTNLIPGTQYWFDLAIKVNGGQGNVSELNFIGHSLI